MINRLSSIDVGREDQIEGKGRSFFLLKFAPSATEEFLVTEHPPFSIDPLPKRGGELHDYDGVAIGQIVRCTVVVRKHY